VELPFNFNDKEDRILKESFGFDGDIQQSTKRFINRDGSFNIHRIGYSVTSPYQSLVGMSWWKFLLIIITIFVFLNIIYAFLFLLTGIENFAGIIASNNPLDQFGDLFFLSVQTFTTVGYGQIAPSGFWANIVSSLTALSGLLSLALATGLVFARFSKPKPGIVFSEHALIAPIDDGWSFQFRMANSKKHRIMDLSATVVMTWVVKEGNGYRRHFTNIPLVRDKISLFPINWTVIHKIDDQSPLKSCQLKTLKDMRAEFLVMLHGYDESYSKRIQQNTSYLYDEIKWYFKFNKMYEDHADKGTIFDLDRIDEIESVKKN